MTVVEEQTALTVATPAPAAPPTFRARASRSVLFGTAAGVEIEGGNLHVTLVRVRPAGAFVAGSTTISEFRTRPAKEWGSEFHTFLRKHGEKHLSSTVVIPRSEVIVRQLALPGVARKDMDAAIGYQVDGLHPYGDEDVAFAWSPIAPGGVLLGIVRQTVLENYIAFFRDAGVPCSGFTFSASALFSATRLFTAAPSEFAAWREDATGAVEIYGESAARGVFSASFDMPAERALQLARAELRLAPEDARALTAILPQPLNVAPYPPLSYAAALATVGNWRKPFANLLPAASRTVRSRARWVPTIILTVFLAAAAATLFAYQQVREQRFLAELSSQIAKLQPAAIRVTTVEKRTGEVRARSVLLDDYRKQAQLDIAVLAELSRLLPAPVWTQSVEITKDFIVIAGEADQAGPLLKILDSSPFFQNSEPQMGISRVPAGEQFRIRAQRRPGK